MPSVDTSLPLVSCLMPTYNRRPFIGKAIEYFFRQDYPNRELIIIDDGTDMIKDLVPDDGRIRYFRLDKKIALGAKLNMACEHARGTIMAHWDDDDWYACRRLTYQVETLVRQGTDICGLKNLLYYDIGRRRGYQYVYPENRRKWLLGSTLCYMKSHWAGNRFREIDVGMDGYFVWAARPDRVTILEDPTFAVFMIHAGNVSPKKTGGAWWHPHPVEEIQNIVGSDLHFYTKSSKREIKPTSVKTDCEGIALQKRQIVKQNVPKPKVSCILVTHNRREFVSQAIKYFLRQDYPEKQLIILDDGTDEIMDLVPDLGNIEYIRLEYKLSVGEKRNKGVEASQGDIILFWDDDDWYSPDRITYQVGSLVDENVDATVLQNGLVFDLQRNQFWICKPSLRDKMFSYGVIGGTIAFKKSIFDHQVRFPNTNLAEDAEFLSLLYSAGHKVLKMPAIDKFIYVRHHKNTWIFSKWQTINHKNWQLADTPFFIPIEDLHFYTRLMENRQGHNPNIHPLPNKVKKNSNKIYQQKENISLSNKGAMLYREGAYYDALICLEKAACTESNNPWILFDLGLCYLALNRFMDAFNMLQSAKAKITSNTWVWSALGITLARLGRYQEARDAFITARSISDKNHEAEMFLDGFSESSLLKGIQDLNQGKYYSALTFIDAAIFKDPNNSRALFHKGKILMTLDLLYLALPYLISADLLDPNKADISFNIGKILSQFGFYAQGLLFFNKAEEIDSLFFKEKKALDDLCPIKPTAFNFGNIYHPCGSSAMSLDFIKYLDTGDGSLFEEYIFLYGITRLLRPNLVLEIGTNTGISTIIFAKAMHDSNIAGKVVTVDDDNKVLETARDQIDLVGMDKYIEICEGESLKALSKIMEKYPSFDLCFLDGSHAYDIVKKEFGQLKESCHYFLFHDTQLFAGVKKLIEELDNSSEFKLVEIKYPLGEKWSGGRIQFRSSPGIVLLETGNHKSNAGRN